MYLVTMDDKVPINFIDEHQLTNPLLSMKM